MPRIVVTGGAGFIGSNLVAALNERGERDILVVDRLGDGPKWRNLVDLAFADYMEREAFRAALRGGRLGPAQAVVHLGACSRTTETDASFLFDNNTEFTDELCAWCLHNGARFVYASSAATYGDGAAGYGDGEADLAALRPLNMYGYSKHLFDRWAADRGLFDRIVGLKFFNVFGPREDHKGTMRSMVLKAFEQIDETGRVRLFCSEREGIEDGEQKRDFLYVDDAVRVVLHFLDHPETGGLFNVGAGKARTWNDLARAVFKAMGIEVRIEYIDLPPELADRYQYYTQADIRKLRSAGYTTPFLSLEDGVSDYVTRFLLPRVQGESAEESARA